ncbi:MAG: DUF917 domain-containing protein [Anaerolineae bacterium]|jgi:uncharacterized protein|nr:DUF917 domain-containing protein [Anaerolineae bacterium]MBT7191392.1 DUF917 domain-containing protein [Anaerolineae bacterium]MBT7989080.1 DUF917 domain-containing protein [Anaerolineae bacterium]
MRRTTLKTLQDCEDLLEGALWMGTGGGGSFEEGMEKLKKVLDDGLSIEWVDPDEIPDDIWTATVGLHGSIAPLSEEILYEISSNGLTETPEWYLVKAVKELGEFLGHDFKCLVAAELGPDSVAIPLAVGAYLGIPVVDGDYIGRAVPEEMQSTYCLYEKQSNLFAGVDRWGNSIFVKNAVNTHALERIAKMLAVASYGDIAVATTPLIAEEMKKIVVPGTLSQCLKIGQALRASRESGRDPVDAGVEASQGWRLFDGTVASLKTEDRDGYYFGTVKVEGSGDFQDQTLKVWFKNENQITWLNGSPWICSPDLVTFVYKKNGRGVFNAELDEGDEISVIGMKGVEGFRTNYGLSLAGPEHFGFDIDYVPIEDLLEKQEATLDSQGV